MKKRILSALLACTMTAASAAALSGCGGGGESGGEVKISVGSLPSQETEPERYQVYLDYIEKYESMYPGRKVEIDTSNMDDMDQIMVNGAAGLLPNIFRVPYTNVKLMIENGYARDITSIMKERGYDTTIRPELIEMVSDDSGNIYGVPSSGYMMGMMYNMNLFEQAGLVKDDGTIDPPQTFEEVAETARIITEKTGKPGFAIQAKDRECGWTFMNVAWNYGVKFMEEGEDGKYTATFDSPEMVSALQWLSDLKWKQKALPENMLIDRTEIIQLFATDQLGMLICAEDFLPRPTKEYEMDKNRVASSAMPAGPEGRYSLIGGTVWLISPETTDEQLEAIFDWIDLIGYAPEISADAQENTKKELEAKVANDDLIIPASFSVFQDPERQKVVDELYAPYINVDTKIMPGLGSDDVTMHMEEPEDAQQLYQVITNIIQEILLDENAGIAALVKQGQESFQKDSLDK
ncbi:MAG TPA: extracellular solute-binding protein [Candidatus Ornithomonoglobus intestinigallinarum]|uniref:Extracellular solute-binding protein n=1 Tax=Candidatus Ornithomonoglobus intestinigallinarum TaxID=2840894 RepID=A0A9D1H312_9FIRM|nr:extracellular solute-binding protein [Candidatus Ornithomonoglobus intestinigallinarum]